MVAQLEESDRAVGRAARAPVRRGWCARDRGPRAAARGGTIACGALLLCVLAGPLDSPEAARAAQPCSIRQVAREELVDAMRRVRGYDIAATTNAPRFGAEVFLDLGAAATAAGADDLLLIRQEDWFRAFLQVAGLTEEQAPPGARLAREYRHDMLIDYQRGRVLAAVEEGREPRVVLAVHIAWPAGRPGPQEYSYHDTLSVPRVRVTTRRVVQYRLLAFDGMIVYDEMDGLYGRPTTGLLGALFSVIGDARVLESRFAVAQDGFQVVRARAKKGLISSTSVATFAPDGRGEKGIPPQRPDLERLAEVLKRPVNVVYRPFRCTEAVG